MFLNVIIVCMLVIEVLTLIYGFDNLNKMGEKYKLIGKSKDFTRYDIFMLVSFPLWIISLLYLTFSGGWTSLAGSIILITFVAKVTLKPSWKSVSDKVWLFTDFTLSAIILIVALIMRLL